MARQILKRSEAVAWLPAKAQVNGNLGLGEGFLFWGPNSRTPLLTTIEAIGKLKSICLVLDARDVLVTSAQVPPLSPAKLAQALPNILEDQLIQDPSQVVIGLGERGELGSRTIAVADRAWVESVKGSFERRGVKVSAIWPAQLALPKRADRWVLAATSTGLTFKSENNALGWPTGSTPMERLAALHSFFDTLAIQERVDPSTVGIDVMIDDAQWSDPFRLLADERRLQLEVFAIVKPQAASIDLNAAIVGRPGKTNSNDGWRWSQWRLPLALVGLTAMVAIAGLNLRWWQLERERKELIALSEQTFRGAFPKVNTVVDPRRQAERLVQELRKNNGQPSPDDFNVLIARLGDALDVAASDALASIEFSAGQLKVKFQPGLADSAPARDQLRQSLTRTGLLVSFPNEREPIALISPMP